MPVDGKRGFEKATRVSSNRIRNAHRLWGCCRLVNEDNVNVALQQAPNDCSERNSGEASQASVCGDCICPFNPALSRHVRGKLGVRVCVHSTLIHTRVRFLLSRGGGAAKAETLCSTARSCSRPPHRHEACKAKSSGWSLWVKVALL